MQSDLSTSWLHTRLSIFFLILLQRQYHFDCNTAKLLSKLGELHCTYMHVHWLVVGLVVVTVLKLGFHCKRFPMWQKRFPKSFTEYEPVIRISLAFKSKLEQSRGGKMEDPIISKDSSHIACSWAKQLTCYQLGTKRFNCLGTKCPNWVWND